MTATPLDTPSPESPAAPIPAVSSTRRRFIFTVATNLTRTGVSFATTMLTARWLGPSSYGTMAFLLGTFAGVRAALDMGSAAAFFTFMSQQTRSQRFVRRFFVWLALQFVLPLIVIGLVVPASWTTRIWHDAPLPMILLAFAAAFMQGSVWPVVQQVCESQRRTYLAQGLGVTVVLVHLVAVGCFWWFGMLAVPALMGAVAVEYMIAAAVALQLLEFPGEAGPEPLRDYLRRFITYCLPLVPFAAVSFGNEFVDRWMLQQYGGGVQQAFYSVSAQLASISLIATTSILSIFWKEIAEAHHRKDHVRTAALYRRVTRLLFFVGATVSGFLMPWSGELLRFILGPAYVGGASALMIMLLYPVHQTMGQVGATMMYATERVGVQVIVGSAVMVLGMITTYFVLAPPTNAVPGFGLGSTGLTLKMVGIQILSVNLLAFAIARLNGWKFDWVFQPLALGICIGAGWLAHVAVASSLPSAWALPIRIVPAGVIYCALLLTLTFWFPGLLASTRDDYRSAVARVTALIRRRRMS